MHNLWIHSTRELFTSMSASERSLLGSYGDAFERCSHWRLPPYTMDRTNLQQDSSPSPQRFGRLASFDISMVPSSTEICDGLILNESNHLVQLTRNDPGNNHLLPSNARVPGDRSLIFPILRSMTDISCAYAHQVTLTGRAAAVQAKEPWWLLENFTRHLVWHRDIRPYCTDDIDYYAFNGSVQFVQASSS